MKKIIKQTAAIAFALPSSSCSAILLRMSFSVILLTPTE